MSNQDQDENLKDQASLHPEPLPPDAGTTIPHPVKEAQDPGLDAAKSGAEPTLNTACAATNTPPTSVSSVIPGMKNESSLPPRVSVSAGSKKKASTKSRKGSEIDDEEHYITLGEGMSGSFIAVNEALSKRGFAELPPAKIVDFIWHNFGARVVDSFVQMRLQGTNPDFTEFLACEKRVQEHPEFLGEGKRIKFRLSEKVADELTEKTKLLCARFGTVFHRRTVLNLIWFSFGLLEYIKMVERNPEL